MCVCVCIYIFPEPIANTLSELGTYRAINTLLETTA